MNAKEWIEDICTLSHSIGAVVCVHQLQNKANRIVSGKLPAMTITFIFWQNLVLSLVASSYALVHTTRTSWRRAMTYTKDILHLMSFWLGMSSTVGTCPRTQPQRSGGHFRCSWSLLFLSCFYFLSFVCVVLKLFGGLFFWSHFGGYIGNDGLVTFPRQILLCRGGNGQRFARASMTSSQQDWPSFKYERLRGWLPWCCTKC